METSQSVLCGVQRNDWMISIYLKDAYLQVPVYPDRRRLLRFVTDGKVYQFKVLCFGLSTAPQVFTRVMAPVSVMLHDLGVWILWYQDDWLVPASSRKEALWARDVCSESLTSLESRSTWLSLTSTPLTQSLL